MRRLTLALLAVLSLAVASPAAAAPIQDFKDKGSIPPCKYSDRELGKSLGDLPPDIEQYAPGYAEQLRNNRGAPCSGKGAPGGGGTTTGANERVEDVPVPPSVGGGGGAGGSGTAAAGASATERVGKPPIPVPVPRTKLADVTSPAITSGPTGPDVPAWVLALIAAVLLVGSARTALFLYGGDLSRFTRPLGVAAGEARARSSDRAIQLWETVRLGR